MEVAASSFFRLCIPTNCSLLLLPGRGSQPYQRHRQSRGAAKCIRTISSGSGSCSGEVVGGDSDDLRCEGSRRLWKVWEEWEEWKLLRRSGGSRRRERGRCKVCRAVEPDVLSVIQTFSFSFLFPTDYLLPLRLSSIIAKQCLSSSSDTEYQRDAPLH